MYNYESPIEILVMQMNTKFENDILTCVQNYYPSINKEELVKALQYDRDQYDKGYRNGVETFKARIINKITEMRKEILDEYKKYMDGEDYRKVLLLEEVANIIKDL